MKQVVFNTICEDIKKKHKGEGYPTLTLLLREQKGRGGLVEMVGTISDVFAVGGNNGEEGTVISLIDSDKNTQYIDVEDIFTIGIYTGD